MTKQIEELTAQIEELKRVLAQHGIQTAEYRDLPATERPDYIPHGSTEHAAFLGLVEITEDDTMESLSSYTSPRTQRTFRLEDEMGAIRHYPGVDPEKAVRLVLQQKVNELEGIPEVPADAPPMFRPAAVYPS
jgi:hypothetical protein